MIQCKVVEIDQTLSANNVTLGFPDENGQQLTLNVATADLPQLAEGQSYSLDFSAVTAPPAAAQPGTPSGAAVLAAAQPGAPAPADTAGC